MKCGSPHCLGCDICSPRTNDEAIVDKIAAQAASRTVHDYSYVDTLPPLPPGPPPGPIPDDARDDPNWKPVHKWIHIVDNNPVPTRLVDLHSPAHPLLGSTVHMNEVGIAMLSNMAVKMSGVPISDLTNEKWDQFLYKSKNPMLTEAFVAVRSLTKGGEVIRRGTIAGGRKAKFVVARLSDRYAAVSIEIEGGMQAPAPGGQADPVAATPMQDPQISVSVMHQLVGGVRVYQFTFLVSDPSPDDPRGSWFTVHSTPWTRYSALEEQYKPFESDMPGAARFPAKMALSDHTYSARNCAVRAAKLQLFLADLLRRAIDLYARKEEKIRSRRLFDAFHFDDETRGVFEQVAETLKGLAAARGDPRYTCAFNLTEQERDPKYLSPEERARMMRTWQTVQGRRANRRDSALAVAAIGGAIGGGLLAVGAALLPGGSSAKRAVKTAATVSREVGREAGRVYVRQERAEERARMAPKEMKMLPVGRSAGGGGGAPSV